jgi:outer membrane protein assembly factor BamE (lipoprotein component of BamABCDE complex)
MNTMPMNTSPINKSSLIPIIGILSFVALVLFGYAHSESYCFLYPNIDTRYAPGYTESGFNQITPGMTAQTVEQLIGRPFNIGMGADGTEYWFYSQDGNALFGDWAWLGREVIVREQRVVAVAQRVFHD